jgi:hypothetical protein
VAGLGIARRDAVDKQQDAFSGRTPDGKIGLASGCSAFHDRHGRDRIQKIGNLRNLHTRDI